MARHSLIIALIALMATGCDRAPSPAATKNDAVRIADDTVRTKFPESNLRILKRYIRDGGDTWIVEYHVPEGYAGGGPTIEIDKSSRKVSSAWASQ